MGKIVIKIPENKEEEIELNVSYQEIKEKLEELEKEKKLQYLKNFTKKYKGKLEIPEINDDELYS